MAAVAGAAKRKRELVEDQRPRNAAVNEHAFQASSQAGEHDELDSLWRQAMRDCGEDLPD